ncbi:glycerol dehydrogenase [Clostridium botulinum C]|uniref:glycerol dehydrogenase n=1 Tax=Clostridium botulinum TaxID=1491 RepID=UPI001E377208|nr:glycerol dehydrogenase [Clostridium botulinum]MCD3244841.1 glycerol dehydrogenase [Clostridium botulinum C]MCD3261599.1 glycerol dehydrogenase [Clostridium botulinum C]
MIKALISPSKYIQGAGLWAKLNRYIPNIKGDILILVDSFMYNKVEGIIGNNLNKNHLNYSIYKFGGESSLNEINRIKNLVNKNKSSMILGIGGGKTLDTARAVGFYTKIVTIIVPTIAATDSPTSSSSVIYTENGEFSEYIYCDKNPDVVIVDTEIIANSPVRFLVSGMGDALATYFEARACKLAGAVVGSNGKSTQASMILAKECYESLLRDGLKAKIAVENNVVTKAVENIIETNIYLSGIGFESGGLAAAHAVHNGLTLLHEVHGMYHGEKVAFGTLVQLILENADLGEIKKLIKFCIEVGLPVTLQELGVKEINHSQLLEVAELSCSDKDTMKNMPFKVSPKDVYAAILSADSMGRRYKG